MNNNDQYKRSQHNKRKAETCDSNSSETEAPLKVAKTLPPDNILSHSSIQNESSDTSLINTNVIDDALKTLEYLQKELNKDNYQEDSDSSDSESCSENDYDACNRQMMDEAHTLGYTACIHETFRFLDSFGIQENDPIYEHLKKRFIESANHN